MGTKGVDLEWKEFFGSSVSLVPSLISIYDEKVKKDSIPSGTDEPSSTLQADPRKRPSSIRSNDSSSSTSSRPSKKKMTPSAKNLAFRRVSAKDSDFSLNLEKGCGLISNDSMENKFENRRSKSVENGARVKKHESFNAFLVCREILETEKIYVRDLKETIEGYKRAMESQPNLFAPETVEILFGNIEDIYSFHCELLKELNLHERDVGKLSDSFVNNTAHFKMYSKYCTNYPRSQKIVMNISGEETASSWLQEQQMALNHKLPLSSYLLKPVQRILKYHLLFQNLIKSFDGCDGTDNVELVKASSALSCMSSMARYINEMKRIHDKNVKMKEILDLLVACNPNFNLSGSGELIIEDKFQFGVKTLQHILLFKKQILICKWKENCALLIKVQIPCSNLMLVETVSKSPLSFSIHPFTDPSLLFTIQAKSLEQKSIWCHEIRKSILSNFDAHIPDRARNIVMNLTPEVATTNQIDEKGFGQIEWRKNSRRCSMAFVPDIRQPTKSNEVFSSTDNSCLEGKQKHLPLSQSLFSIADEPARDQIPAIFSISSTTLTMRSPDNEANDRDAFSAYTSLRTLDRSCVIGHERSEPPEFTRRTRKENTAILKRNSSADNCLTSKGADDRSENLSQGSGETYQCSNSSAGSDQSWSGNRPNIPKRSGSLHHSSLHSTSSKTSFRNTLLNLKDRFKKRSHSTDNRHYKSTPKLQGMLEDRAGYIRKPSQRLISRFALSNRNFKSNLDNDEDITEPGEGSQNCGRPNLRSQFINGMRVSPRATYQKAGTMSEGSKRCFSPPPTAKILFIDDSDDG